MEHQNYNNMPYYGPPAPNRPQEPQPSGLSIASLVLGIIGIVTCCGYYFGLIFGVLGLALGIAGYASRKTKFGIAAIIVSSVATGLCLIYTAFMLFMIFADEFLFNYPRYMSDSLLSAVLLRL